MNKKVITLLILLSLVIMTVTLFICKPYLRHEKIITLEGELLIRTNLITSNMRFFDSTSMKWYERDEYIDLKIRKITDQFEKLIIKDYQSFIDILEGKEKSTYSFIPADKLVEFKTKDILISTSRNGDEIISRRKTLVSEFNQLIMHEKEKRINDIRGFINQGHFPKEGMKNL